MQCSLRFFQEVSITKENIAFEYGKEVAEKVFGEEFDKDMDLLSASQKKTNGCGCNSCEKLHSALVERIL